MEDVLMPAFFVAGIIAWVAIEHVLYTGRWGRV
jgi:hypothetical protein